MTMTEPWPSVRVIAEEIIPEFGGKAPGTSASSQFRSPAVIRIIGGVAEEEAAILRYRRGQAAAGDGA